MVLLDTTIVNLTITTILVVYYIIKKGGFWLIIYNGIIRHHHNDSNQHHHIPSYYNIKKGKGLLRIYFIYNVIDWCFVKENILEYLYYFFWIFLYPFFKNYQY